MHGKKMLKKYMDLSRQSMILLSCDGDVIHANSRALEQFGGSLTERRSDDPWGHMLEWAVNHKGGLEEFVVDGSTYFIECFRIEDDLMCQGHSTNTLRQAEITALWNERDDPTASVLLLTRHMHILCSRAYWGHEYAPGTNLYTKIPQAQHKPIVNVSFVAQDTPGEWVQFGLTVSQAGKRLNTHARIMFIPNRIYGGWYRMIIGSGEDPSDGILNRLRYAYGAKNDTELAELMRTSKSSISRAKTSGVPAELLRQCFQERGFSMDWLETGHGHMRSKYK